MGYVNENNSDPIYIFIFYFGLFYFLYIIFTFLRNVLEGGSVLHRPLIGQDPSSIPAKVGTRHLHDYFLASA